MCLLHAQEIGSTVKHLSWDIPTCVASGAWNVRLLLLLARAQQLTIRHEGVT